jgi:hypothetical protein
LPFQRALTGPTLTLAIAWNSVSEILSSCSHPGTQLLSVSVSLSFAQTSSRGAASWTCPLIVIAIVDISVLSVRY